MSQSSLCIRPLIIEGLSLLPEETTDPKHEPRRGQAKGGDLNDFTTIASRALHAALTLACHATS